MRFRKLRMAWSVVWGAATVLLIVLWVRSYWWSDALQGSTLFGWVIDVEFYRGHIYANASHSGDVLEWQLYTAAVGPENALATPTFFHIGSGAVAAFLPHRYLTIVVAILATVPWIPFRRRFSLRTLLISTTLVAAVLGLITFAVR